jgi:hypothetical protein
MWANCWPPRLLAPKGFSRRPCRSCGQRLARVVRRRRRFGGRYFFGSDAFSIHGALRARHGPQASPCFLERGVRRRLSPPCVAISALPRSFLSLICSVCAHCSTSLCRPFGFRYPLATLALLVPPPFSPSEFMYSARGWWHVRVRGLWQSSPMNRP